MSSTRTAIAAGLFMVVVVAGAAGARADEAPPELVSAKPSPKAVKKAPPESPSVLDARSSAMLAKAMEAIRADPRIFDESLARKILPTGWTLETKGLPSGVRGMALGPALEDGRTVVLLSRAPELPAPAAWEGDDARTFVERTLATAEEGIAITAIVREGVLGGPEVFAEKRAGKEEPLLVRYAFTSEPAGWMLTIIAPSAQFAPIYERISGAFGGGGKKATLGSAQKL